MGYSGQELVEQEKCKLVYAHFFDGVQCFDSVKNWLQVATPDYEFNSYDYATKTLTTKTFSVTPVTPTDPNLDNIKRPFLTLRVSINITGLKVILTADDYTKTRIIPLYYLDTCDSYSWNSSLKICIDTYQNKVVTRVSFTSGWFYFLTNSIFKYIDIEGSTYLYRLKTFDKNIVHFELNIPAANEYFFPLAYYVEEIPASAERAIINNFNYAKEYTTYDKALYPCGSTLGPDDYLNFDIIISSTFSSNVNYRDETINEWDFNIILFNDNYTFNFNILDVSILFFNLDTGIYTTRHYRFDFYDKNGAAINLETAIDQENPNFNEFLQDLGTANCSARFEIYYESEYQEGEDRLINAYNYPQCGLEVYDLETCNCAEGALCSEALYPCETCDPETGVITDDCESWEVCTVLGCKTPGVTSACICEGTEYGIETFPTVRASFDVPTCSSESYERYLLYDSGAVYADMGYLDVQTKSQFSHQTLPAIYLFNIYDYITPSSYNYDGEEKTISVRAFLCLKYLGSTFESLENDLSYDALILKLEDVVAICPNILELKLDWFNHQSSKAGAFTNYGSPCNFMNVNIQFAPTGEITQLYTIYAGMNFIFPAIYNFDSAINSSIPQEAYDNYCEKIKFLGSDQAYTLGVYSSELPLFGDLEI